MKEVFEKLELAVRRTSHRLEGLLGEQSIMLLGVLGDEILRLAMEESGGVQVDE